MRQFRLVRERLALAHDDERDEVHRRLEVAIALSERRRREQRVAVALLSGEGGRNERYIMQGQLEVAIALSERRRQRQRVAVALMSDEGEDSVSPGLF